MTFTRYGYHDQFLVHLFRGKSLVGGVDFLFLYVVHIHRCLLYCPLLYFLSQGLSLNLELIDLAGLAKEFQGFSCLHALHPPKLVDMDSGEPELRPLPTELSPLSLFEVFLFVYLERAQTL